MEEQKIQEPSTRPTYRVWLCGPFLVERLVGQTFIVPRSTDWGARQATRTLLKALLCAPGRQMRRSALLDQLWPMAPLDKARRDLSVALSHLHKLLVSSEQGSLLTRDALQVGLAGQAIIWTDAEAALACCQEAERLGSQTPAAIPFLEKALTYLNRGPFLADDEGEWTNRFRATMEQSRYRASLWLADAYGQQNKPGQAEALFLNLLHDDPTDEDVVHAFMTMLHQHGLSHQALKVYQQTNSVFVREGIELSKTLQMLASHIQETHQPTTPPMWQEKIPSTFSDKKTLLPKGDETEALDRTRRTLLQYMLHFTGTVAFTPDITTNVQGLELLSGNPSHLFKNNALAPEQVHDFATLTAVCRRLSEGSELKTAECILWSFLPRLEYIFSSSSKKGKQTAGVLSQGYLLAASLAGHRNDLRARQWHSEQALFYGEMAEDDILQVAALRQLATTFNYLELSHKVLETYQRALPFLDRVPPLLRVCILASLSGAYAKFQRRYDAEHAMGLAYENFGEHHGEVPDVLRSINASENVLIQWAGNNYLRLGQPRLAETAFLKLDVLDARMPLPKRIRIEAIDCRARMFVAIDNMEQACCYLEHAFKLAVEVGSSLRLREIGETFQILRKKWPQEKRTALLSDLFVQTLIDHAQ